MNEHGKMVGRLGTIDSAPFLVAEIFRPSVSWKGILVLIGAYYAGKGAWCISKNTFKFLKLYSFVPLTMSFHTGYRTRFGTFALVSRVSEGLSTDIVLALASQGLNVIMFGTNPDYLYKLEYRLRLEFGVHGISITTSPHETFILNDVMKLVSKYNVGILVNYLGGFDSTNNYFGNGNPQTEWEWEIPKSVETSLILTRFVLPGMYSRGRGIIVNVLPKLMTTNKKKLPHSITAMSCLRFVETLEECIHTSYSFRGIKVQTFTPYMDAMAKTPADEVQNKNAFISVQPSTASYAKSVVRLLGKCESTHGYWSHSIYYGLSQILPQFVMTKVTSLMKHEYPFGDGPDGFLW